MSLGTNARRALVAAALAVTMVIVGACTPTPAPSVPGATLLATGPSLHVCVLVAGGAVKCWGDNFHGQLGNGNTNDSNTAGKVMGITGATQLVVGDDHTCALVAGGAVKCWGWNGYGQLGNGANTDATTPVGVTGITGATALAAGSAHTCAVVASGVKCWGRNDVGQLGNGTNSGTNTAVDVVGVSGATAIAAGAYYTCALIISGSVKCWGDNSDGELGNGTYANTNTGGADLPGVAGASAISAGSFHACALVAGGAVKCWGSNTLGQLGDGTNTGTNRAGNVVPGIVGATALTTGGAHTCVVVNGGAAKCWGWNFAGGLGNGTKTDSNSPVDVIDVDGATAISGGVAHTCALLSGGGVKCWGYNSEGELGNGTNTNSTTAVDVLGFP